MNHTRFVDALDALLRRTNEDAFVVFANGRTGRFVQFAGSARAGLLLDLPEQTLDPAEAGRAEVYFQGLGVRAEEYDLGDRRLRTYQLDLGRDVEAAAAVVAAVFERVYQSPEGFDLAVTEN